MGQGRFFSNRRHRPEQERNDSKFQELNAQETETATFDAVVSVSVGQDGGESHSATPPPCLEIGGLLWM